MTNKHTNIEGYEKRFGTIAIQKGFITLDELIKALTIQIQEEIQSETHRQIGEILLYEDLMNGNQIEEVVKTILGERAEV